MKKMVIATLAAFSLMLTSCDQVASILSDTGITNEESVEALKSALAIGIDSGTTDIASMGYANYTIETTDSRGVVTNAIIKIFLPKEANDVLDYLDSNPFANAAFQVASGYSSSGMRSQLINTINSAADSAAPQSISVFKDAITNKMTISDGMKILTAKDSLGKQDSIAATNYLNTNTRTGLTGIYQPIVRTALNKVGAATTWTKFANGYNAIMSGNIRGVDTRDLPASIPAQLDEYATGKALDGLFFVVGHEETKIRRNPLQYASAIVQKVFGSLKN